MYEAEEERAVPDLLGKVLKIAMTSGQAFLEKIGHMYLSGVSYHTR